MALVSTSMGVGCISSYIHNKLKSPPIITIPSAFSMLLFRTLVPVFIWSWFGKYKLIIVNIFPYIIAFITKDLPYITRIFLYYLVRYVPMKNYRYPFWFRIGKCIVYPVVIVSIITFRNVIWTKMSLLEEYNIHLLFVKKIQNLISFIRRVKASCIEQTEFNLAHSIEREKERRRRKERKKREKQKQKNTKLYSHSHTSRTISTLSLLDLNKVYLTIYSKFPNLGVLSLLTKNCRPLVFFMPLFNYAYNYMVGPWGEGGGEKKKKTNSLFITIILYLNTFISLFPYVYPAYYIDSPIYNYCLFPPL